MAGWASDHPAGGSVGYGDASCGWGGVLEAVLERITYANEETGYTIARVATDRSGADLLTVVGALLGCSRGRPAAGGPVGVAPAVRAAVRGGLVHHGVAGHGAGHRRYLGSGLIKGIGPRTGGRIVDHFGVDALRVIEEQPRRLVEVPGWARNARR